MTLQYREAQNRIIIIIIMNFIGMKYLQFMAKVDYMNTTEQNKITINIVSLFLAERSEIEKRLFLCGRIAQYRGLGSQGYLTCMFQSFYHFFVFDGILICLRFQYLCIQVEGLSLGRDVI